MRWRFWVGLGLGMTVGAALAQTAWRATVERSEPSRLDLAIESPIEVTRWAELNSREILITYRGAVDGTAFAALQRALPPVLEAIGTGYDTVLIRAAGPARFAVDQRLNRIAVSVALLPAGAQATGDDAARRRLDQLRARMLAESGQPGEARIVLDGLIVGRPPEADVLAQRAGLNEQSGRYAAALADLDTAIKADPANPELAAARRRLARDRQTQVKADLGYQKVHGADRQAIDKVAGFAYPDAEREIGFKAEHRTLHTRSLRRIDGRLGSRSDENVQVELNAGVFTTEGGQSRIRAFGARDVYGLGAEHVERAPGRETRFTASYHEPYWDIVQGLADGGTVDKLEIQHQQSFAEVWSLTAGGGRRRYGVRDDQNVADSWRALAALRRTMYSGGGHEISLGYIADNEWVPRRQERFDTARASYAPLDLRSRATHSTEVAWRWDHSSDSWLTVTGGYALDFLTSAKGPLFNLSWSHEPSPEFEIGLRAGFAHTTSRTSDGIQRTAGVFGVWRF